MALAREATDGEQVLARPVWTRRFERRRNLALRKSVGDLKIHRAELMNQLGQLRAESGLNVLQDIAQVDQDIWRLMRDARLAGRAT